MKYYFTYGTDGQPFVGGWTEVEAPNVNLACAVFRAVHPDKEPGDVYKRQDPYCGALDLNGSNFNNLNIFARCHFVHPFRISNSSSK